MPDSLLFDGDDGCTFSLGSFAGTGAVSAAAIVKRTGDDGSTFGFFMRWSSDRLILGTIQVAAAVGVMVTFDGTTERQADPTIVLDYNEWYLLGISKASGTIAPRYHVYRYSTSSWEHGNYDGTLPDFTSLTEVTWGEAGGSESWVGNILIGAVWDSELADGTFETLEFDKAAWVTAAPDEAYRFDTTGTITPFVGSGSHTGTAGAPTLDTGDAPVGWSDTADTGFGVRPRHPVTSRGTSW